MEIPRHRGKSREETASEVRILQQLSRWLVTWQTTSSVANPTQCTIFITITYFTYCATKVAQQNTSIQVTMQRCIADSATGIPLMTDSSSHAIVVGVSTKSAWTVASMSNDLDRQRFSRELLW